jgi:hypothetical protein
MQGYAFKLTLDLRFFRCLLINAFKSCMVSVRLKFALQKKRCAINFKYCVLEVDDVCHGW